MSLILEESVVTPEARLKTEDSMRKTLQFVTFLVVGLSVFSCTKNADQRAIEDTAEVIMDVRELTEEQRVAFNDGFFREGILKWIPDETYAVLTFSKMRLKVIEYASSAGIKELPLNINIMKYEMKMAMVESGGLSKGVVDDIFQRNEANIEKCAIIWCFSGDEHALKALDLTVQREE